MRIYTLVLSLLILTMFGLTGSLKALDTAAIPPAPAKPPVVKAAPSATITSPEASKVFNRPLVPVPASMGEYVPCNNEKSGIEGKVLVVNPDSAAIYYSPNVLVVLASGNENIASQRTSPEGGFGFVTDKNNGTFRIWIEDEATSQGGSFAVELKAGKILKQDYLLYKDRIYPLCVFSDYAASTGPAVAFNYEGVVPPAGGIIANDPTGYYTAVTGTQTMGVQGRVAVIDPNSSNILVGKNVPLEIYQANDVPLGQLARIKFQLVALVGEVINSIVTNEAGAFQFNVAQPGVYRIKAEDVATGQSGSMPVEIKAGQILNQGLLIYKDQIYAINVQPFDQTSDVEDPLLGELYESPMTQPQPMSNYPSTGYNYGAPGSYGGGSFVSGGALGWLGVGLGAAGLATALGTSDRKPVSRIRPFHP